MRNRIEYVVIKQFSDDVPCGAHTVRYHYNVGDIIQLSPSGRLAKRWIHKGFIEQVIK